MIEQLKKKFYLFCIISVFFLIAFSYTLKIPFDPDLGWHMRYGEEIIKNRKILSTDEFTHTVKGIPYEDYEWFSEALFYSIFQKYSIWGLSLVSAILTSLAFLIPIIVIKGRWFAKIPLFLWALAGSKPVLEVGARPQDVTLIFISIVVTMLLLYFRHGKVRYLITFPALFLLWANMHAGYLLGILTIVVYMVFDGTGNIFILFRSGKKLGGELKMIFLKLAPVFLILILSYKVALIRPYSVGFAKPGLSLISSILLPAKLAAEDTLSGSIRTIIAEWQPPLFITIPGSLLVLGALIIFALFAQKKFHRRDFIALGFCTFFLYISTLSRRNTPFFFLASIPILLLFFQNEMRTLLQRKIIKIFMIGLLTIAFISSLQNIHKTSVLLTKYGKNMETYCQTKFYPCDAIEYIRQSKPKGTLYNFYTWGGFLDWVLPQYPVFIDGRMPSSEIFQKYDKVMRVHKDTENILSEYSVRVILIPRSSFMETFFTKDGLWKISYSDDQAVVLTKTK